MTRAPHLGLALGLCAGLAVFGIAEAIHHAGLNPFVAATAAPAPSELAVDGSEMGGGA